jgi:hypothetical protein
MGGPQSRSGRRGEEKIFEPTGTRTPTSRSSSAYSVVIPTALSRVLWTGLYIVLYCLPFTRGEGEKEEVGVAVMLSVRAREITKFESRLEDWLS